MYQHRIYIWISWVRRVETETNNKPCSFTYRFSEDKNTSPLYIKLIFDVVVQMRSYIDASTLDTLLAGINTPVKCIRYIYQELMRKNG